MSTIRALNMGVAARSAGEHLWSNPFVEGSAEFQTWERGWCLFDGRLPVDRRQEQADRTAMAVRAAEVASEVERLPY